MISQATTVENSSRQSEHARERVTPETTAGRAQKDEPSRVTSGSFVFSLCFSSWFEGAGTEVSHSAARIQRVRNLKAFEVYSHQAIDTRKRQLAAEVVSVPG